MSDQERLENIEEEYMWNVSQGNAMPLAHSDIEWLIQQAERAIEGEEELDRWLSGRNVAVSTYGEIRGLNEENARLREALEFIRDHSACDVAIAEAEEALKGEGK